MVSYKINREAIKQAIEEFHRTKLPPAISRGISVPLTSRKIVVLTGVRRCGKTCLLFSFIQSLVNSGIDKKRIVYINFDDPRLLPASNRDLEAILEVYWELYPENQNKAIYLFFDEIQHVRNWEAAIRRFSDTRKFHIFIAGSLSKLLDRDIADSLRGRALNFEVLPFSLPEFLRVKNVAPDKLRAPSPAQFAAKKCLQEYFEGGGFPEVALQPEPGLKSRILKDYVEAMFFKDLSQHHKIKNQMVMRELLKFLISNTAGIFSLNAFWKWIKTVYPITKRTLIYYLSYLEDAGIIFMTKKMRRGREKNGENLRPRKTYIIDNGLRLVYGFDFNKDKRRVLENSVYLALRRAQAGSSLAEIAYWRDGREEVNFVLKEKGKVKGLIQVCADPQEFKAKEKYIQPLVNAMTELKLNKSLVITEGFDGEERIKNKKITYISFGKWALGS